MRFSYRTWGVGHGVGGVTPVSTPWEYYFFYFRFLHPAVLYPQYPRLSTRVYCLPRTECYNHPFLRLFLSQREKSNQPRDHEEGGVWTRHSHGQSREVISQGLSHVLSPAVTVSSGCYDKMPHHG